jgi:hypothetical protein
VRGKFLQAFSKYRSAYLRSFRIISVFNKIVEERNVTFMKYIVAAFIAIGAMLAVSAAQAAPLSPSAVHTEQAVTSGGSVEKVCWGGGCGWGGWGGGGWGGCGCCRPCWRPCGSYGWGCGVRWWPARPWGWGGGGWGGGWGWNGGGWGW